MFRFIAAAVICLLGASFLSAVEEGDYIKVEIKGTLRAGVVAIGGETTGVVIQSGKTTFELDLGGKEDFLAFLKQHDGKTVVVQGVLTERPGVEIKVRRVINVTKMSPGK